MTIYYVAYDIIPNKNKINNNNNHDKSSMMMRNEISSDDIKRLIKKEQPAKQANNCNQTSDQQLT